MFNRAAKYYNQKVMTDSKIAAAERIKQILVILATTAVVAVNYLAAVGYINDKTPAEIADKFPSLLTPAGYAFVIWSFIYFGLIVFSLYQALPSQAANPRFRKIRFVYLLNCAANCAWIFLWHHERIWTALFVIFIILGTLAFINVKLKNKNDPNETWAARVPFGLYFGWVTVATILNFTLALVSSGVSASSQTNAILASILIAAATILGVVIRLKLSSAAYAVALAWAFTAIAVKHGGETTLIFCTAFGVIFLLIAAIFPLTQTREINR